MSTHRLLAFAGQTAASAAIATAVVLWIGPAPLQESAPAAAIKPPPEVSRPADFVTPLDHASYRGAVRAAKPSVVNIYTAKAVRRPRWGWPLPPGFEGGDSQPQMNSLGSGVIWSSDGVIVTNNHVIDGADEIAVVIAGQEPVAARVLGTDPDSDLAVLRIAAKGLPAIPRGSSRKLEIGDVVLAIGNPFGVGQTVTQGIVSATRRNRLGINTFEDFLQTDAAINPGNSGGALVDTTGGLVGINTAIYSRSEGSVGIGFAIPVELVDDVVGQLLKSGRVRRGYLGIEASDLDPDLAARLGVKAGPGVVIAGVEPGGPAGRAGLRAGDVVRAIGQQPVSDSADLVGRTAGVAPGQTVQLQVDRRGATVDIAVQVGERPARRPRSDESVR